MGNCALLPGSWHHTLKRHQFSHPASPHARCALKPVQLCSATPSRIYATNTFGGSSCVPVSNPSSPFPWLVHWPPRGCPVRGPTISPPYTSPPTPPLSSVTLTKS